MSSFVLKIDVEISCAINLYHFSFFLMFVNLNDEFHTYWCFKRSFAVFSQVINTMLTSNYETITIKTSKLSIFAAFSALLTLFCMSMALIVIVSVFDIITKHLSLYEIDWTVVFDFEVFFWNCCSLIYDILIFVAYNWCIYCWFCDV